MNVYFTLQRYNFFLTFARNFIVIFQVAIANALLPASVISPRASRSAQRCLLSSVQWLRLRRGDRRCASLPSGRRFSVESIQPKHNASSTTSIYGKQSPHSAGRFTRYMAIQHSLSEAACCSNHLRNCARWLNSSRFVISMIVSSPLRPRASAGGAVVESLGCLGEQLSAAVH